MTRLRVAAGGFFRYYKPLKTLQGLEEAKGAYSTEKLGKKSLGISITVKRFKLSLFLDIVLFTCSVLVEVFQVFKPFRSINLITYRLHPLTCKNEAHMYPDSSSTN